MVVSVVVVLLLLFVCLLLLVVGGGGSFGFFKIFDAQVQPVIVLYGAEIWGLESSSSVIDNVHLFGLKRYLGVDRGIPNDLVYGEVGRFPIQMNASVRCIRYWLKLTRIDGAKAETLTG